MEEGGQLSDVGHGGYGSTNSNDHRVPEVWKLPIG